jgi:hypothetical protein
MIYCSPEVSSIHERLILLAKQKQKSDVVLPKRKIKEEKKRSTAIIFSVPEFNILDYSQESAATCENSSSEFKEKTQFSKDLQEKTKLLCLYNKNKTLIVENR